MLKLLMMLMISGFLLINFSFAQEKKESTKKETEQKSEVVIEKSEKKPWNKICPIKGGEVEEGTAVVEYRGKVYGFCCPGCDVKFAKNPEKYSKNISSDGKRFVGRK